MNINLKEINRRLHKLLVDLKIKLVIFKIYLKLAVENYNDKAKLSVNVFEDFEKQTSWQSYTTLLITDIVNDKIDRKEFLARTHNSNRANSKTMNNTRK
jgi:hypothetical protein